MEKSRELTVGQKGILGATKATFFTAEVQQLVLEPEQKMEEDPGCSCSY